MGSQLLIGALKPSVGLYWEKRKWAQYLSFRDLEVTISCLVCSEHGCVDGQGLQHCPQFAVLFMALLAAPSTYSFLWCCRRSDESRHLNSACPRDIQSPGDLLLTSLLSLLLFGGGRGGVPRETSTHSLLHLFLCHVPTMHQTLRAKGGEVWYDLNPGEVYSLARKMEFVHMQPLKENLRQNKMRWQMLGRVWEYVL